LLKPSEYRYMGEWFGQIVM